MKNINLKTISWAAYSVLILTMFAQIPALAQDDPYSDETADQQNEEVLRQPNNDRNKIVGTWDVLVTARNCQTGAPIVTFASLTTFLPGGIILDSTSGIPQASKTPGQGVWERLTRHSFLFKFKSFSFDAGGNFTGWTIITHVADLNNRATAYTSAGTAEIYNTTGDLIATRCTTTTTTRF